MVKEGLLGNGSSKGESGFSSLVTRRTCFFLVCQAIFLTIYILSSNPSGQSSSPSSSLSQSTTTHFTNLTPSTHRPAACTPDFVGFIKSATQSKTPPQLSFDQLLFIKTIVQTSAYTVTSSPTPRRHNFLVWGLGFDSPIWENANCVATGGFPSNIGTEGTSKETVEADAKMTRTLFIENWRNWITDVQGKHPSLEVVHFDNYEAKKGASVGTSEVFFEKPYLLPLPSAVSDVCWNVVLVDAPQGYESTHPGRHASTYWSVSMAHRCLKQGLLDTVTIFLHDVNRPLEIQIIERILKPNGGVQIGYLKGPKGTLVAFRFSRESVFEGR
ncbi:hypothetical protein HDV00_000220 [Rhizophlyctis rosea]|nr:hypothetical protein HDV00_000220 [Rhizophlyctis rosea]